MVICYINTINSKLVHTRTQDMTCAIINPNAGFNTDTAERDIKAILTNYPLLLPYLDQTKRFILARLSYLEDVLMEGRFHVYQNHNNNLH